MLEETANSLSRNDAKKRSDAKNSQQPFPQISQIKYTQISQI